MQNSHPFAKLSIRSFIVISKHNCFQSFVTSKTNAEAVKSDHFASGNNNSEVDFPSYFKDNGREIGKLERRKTLKPKIKVFRDSQDIASFHK